MKIKWASRNGISKGIANVIETKETEMATIYVLDSGASIVDGAVSAFYEMETISISVTWKIV